MQIVSFFVSHWQEILGDLSAMATGAYALALLVPGDQPDKAIEAFLNFTKSWSVK